MFDHYKYLQDRFSASCSPDTEFETEEYVDMDDCFSDGDMTDLHHLDHVSSIMCYMYLATLTP